MLDWASFLFLPKTEQKTWPESGDGCNNMSHMILKKESAACVIESYTYEVAIVGTSVIVGYPRHY